MTLTSKQRAHLRRLAHALEPVVLVGADGVTDAVIRSVAEAFHTRELLKVKLSGAAPVDVRSAAAQIASGVEGAETVQTIGRVAVLYRPHPEKPEIVLRDARG